MSQFNFRLEKVWRHRQRLVDKNSLEVAQADRRVARLARHIVELDGNISRHHHTLEPCIGQQLQTSELITGAAWLDHLQTLRSDLEGQLETATRDLARFRARLTESWRDLEILSRLKDRQEATWQTVQDRKERRETDEIGRSRRRRPGQVQVSGRCKVLPDDN
ncbi:MAG: flagellar export protein FliJ [Candidatus Krumholzibacteriota bacterium]